MRAEECYGVNTRCIAHNLLIKMCWEKDNCVIRTSSSTKIFLVKSELYFSLFLFCFLVLSVMSVDSTESP